MNDSKTDAVSFRNEVFWHAPSDGLLLWNARLRKGWTCSVSSIVDTSGSEDFTTPYAALHKDREREAVWERVRQEGFSELPSRMKALFLFKSREDGERANATWWAGENRLLIPVLVPVASKLHIADSKHLDTSIHHWESNARRYWNGEPTDDPHMEVILHGAAWIPNIDRYNITL